MNDAFINGEKYLFFDIKKFFVGVAEDIQDHPEGGGERIHLFGLAEEEGVVDYRPTRIWS